MEPLEIQLDELRVWSFDGRVLELFGGEETRFHVKLLSVTVSGPGKRGTRQLTLTQSQRQTSFSMDDALLARLAPLLDALRSAGVPVSG